MKFWNSLRWGATIAFLALLLANWFGADPVPHAGSETHKPARPAPTIHR